ncbi:MAG: hypothetical protein AB8H79_02355 [Myxococcota bacterium]
MTVRHTIFAALALASTAFLAIACDGDDPEETGETGIDEGMDDVPFEGDWVDGFDTAHSVSADSWTLGSSTFTFIDVDADEQTIIAENAATNEYNPGLFSRFDWTVVDGQTWYCQKAYDAADADAARNTDPADDSSPNTTGCGGFPWSRLYQPLEIRGSWEDNYGGSHTIREWSWDMDGIGLFGVTSYDNDAGVLIAQNDATNQYNPEKWSRFDWFVDGETTYFCQTAFAAESEAEAEATAPADSSKIGEGCGGFPWTTMVLAP